VEQISQGLVIWSDVRLVCHKKSFYLKPPPSHTEGATILLTLATRQGSGHNQGATRRRYPQSHVVSQAQLGVPAETSWEFQHILLGNSGFLTWAPT
jgi:hypothetical protein